MSTCTFCFASGFPPLLINSIRSVSSKCDHLLIFDLGLCQKVYEILNSWDVQIIKNDKFKNALDINGRVVNWDVLYNIGLSYIAENYNFTHAFMIDSDEYYLGPHFKNFHWVNYYAATVDRIACYKFQNNLKYYSEKELINNHELILARLFNLKNTKFYRFTRQVHPFVLNSHDNLIPPDAFIPAILLHFNGIVNSPNELNKKYVEYNQLFPELNDVNMVLNGLNIECKKALPNKRLEQIAHFYGNIGINKFNDIIKSIIKSCK